jgi:glycosyltransferase involved in cell wall biosynthesis
MSREPLASVVIDNYNSARFLGETIESALAQTYPQTEVVVVDDGSADASRDVIATFGDRVVPVLKENGGQGSALNAGFERCSGDVVVFLDGDDVLLPSAVDGAVRALARTDAAKAHWSLWVIDERGRKTGELVKPELLEGDFREVVRREGPMTEATLDSPPTSGNAWARRFLEHVLPMPEEPYRIMADDYLYGLAPAFGRVEAVPQPAGLYRQHGSNAFGRLSFEERLRHGVVDHEEQCRVLHDFYAGRGVAVDTTAWKAHAWWPRIERSVGELERLVPAGCSFVLVDQDAWGTDDLVRGRRRIRFLERDGEYWGLPEDDAAAIAELERDRGAGACVVAFAWSASWILDEYPSFGRHVRRRFPDVLANDRLEVFDLCA